MASKFSQSELPTNAFVEVEQLIRDIFDKIIGTASERRDQLIEQLNDMRQKYLRGEETRKKHLSELEEIIKQLNAMEIQQNSIVSLQIGQINNLQEERLKFKNSTPVPFPDIRTEGLEFLLDNLMGFGRVEEVGGLYRERINPIRQFGKEGNKKGELNCPSGLALYKNESIYITDTNNHRIQIFSISGKFVAEFGNGKISYPHSIALSDKWVFVGDYIMSAVLKFQITNNKFICQSSKGELNFPSGITADTNGDLLVADSENHRIAVLNSDLKLVGQIGKDKLQYPSDVKINNNNNNNILVADKNEFNNIHVFTKSGEMIRSFIKLDKVAGNIYFCFDLNNNIIVSDFLYGSIQIFTNNGLFIHKIVCENSPKGTAVDNNNNIICACKNGIVCIY